MLAQLGNNALNWCWCNAGPASTTPGQHWTSISSRYCVFIWPGPHVHTARVWQLWVEPRQRWSICRWKTAPSAISEFYPEPLTAQRSWATGEGWSMRQNVRRRFDVVLMLGGHCRRWTSIGTMHWHDVSCRLGSPRRDGDPKLAQWRDNVCDAGLAKVRV